MMRFSAGLLLALCLAACGADNPSESNGVADEGATDNTALVERVLQTEGSDEARLHDAVSKEHILAMSDEDKVEFLSFVEPTEKNLPLLLDFVQHADNVDVRLAALSALDGVEDDPRVVTVVAGLLNESDVSLVLAAIDTLEFVGSAKDIIYLQPLLGSSNPDIKAAAEHAIDFLQE